MPDPPPPSWDETWAQVDKLRADIAREKLERDGLVSRVAILDASINGKSWGIAQLVVLVTNSPPPVTPKADPPAKAALEPEVKAQPQPTPTPKAAEPRPDAPPKREKKADLPPITGGTVKERVIRAMYEFTGPVSAREVADRLGLDYTPVYNSMNDMRIDAKCVGGIPLTERTDKRWTLTDAGRKEGARLSTT